MRIGRRADICASRMVAVGGNCGRQSTADNLRVVELRLTRIPASDENSADRIARPPRKPSLGRLKEARVLMKKRRQNSLRHEVFDHSIGGRRSISLGIRQPALPVAGLAVLRLADPRQKRPPRILHGIERTPGHNRKFLLRCQRRNFPSIFDAQEIWQGIEKPVVRCARSVAFGVRALVILIRRSLVRRRLLG